MDANTLTVTQKSIIPRTTNTFWHATVFIHFTRSTVFTGQRTQSRRGSGRWLCWWSYAHCKNLTAVTMWAVLCRQSSPIQQQNCKTQNNSNNNKQAKLLVGWKVQEEKKKSLSPFFMDDWRVFICQCAAQCEDQISVELHQHKFAKQFKSILPGLEVFLLYIYVL